MPSRDGIHHVSIHRASDAVHLSENNAISSPQQSNMFPAPVKIMEFCACQFMARGCVLVRGTGSHAHMQETVHILFARGEKKRPLTRAGCLISWLRAMNAPALLTYSWLSSDGLFSKETRKKRKNSFHHQVYKILFVNNIFS